LHAERTRFGREVTDWNHEYQKIIAKPTAESDPGERLTLMHYARGLQLLRRKKIDAAHDELKQAATGQGVYAQKAKRNLSVFWLAPALATIYHLLERQEPFYFARKLPESTELPAFLL
jgi:hypothetical protein